MKCAVAFFKGMNTSAVTVGGLKKSGTLPTRGTLKPITSSPMPKVGKIPPKTWRLYAIFVTIEFTAGTHPNETAAFENK